MNDVQVKEAFDYLYLNRDLLTVSQDSFIESIKTQFRRNKILSDNQLKILFEIKKYLRADEFVRTNKY